MRVSAEKVGLFCPYDSRGLPDWWMDGLRPMDKEPGDVGCIVTLDGVDVTGRCISGDDVHGWALLDVAPRAPVQGGYRRLAPEAEGYELRCGHVVISGARRLSLATLITDIVAQARRDERAMVCERLERAGFTARIADDVWDRPEWMRG